MVLEMLNKKILQLYSVATAVPGAPHANSHSFQWRRKFCWSLPFSSELAFCPLQINFCFSLLTKLIPVSRLLYQILPLSLPLLRTPGQCCRSGLWYRLWKKTVCYLLLNYEVFSKVIKLTLFEHLIMLIWLFVLTGPSFPNRVGTTRSLTFNMCLRGCGIKISFRLNTGFADIDYLNVSSYCWFSSAH